MRPRETESGVRRYVACCDFHGFDGCDEDNPIEKGAWAPIAPGKPDKA